MTGAELDRVGNLTASGAGGPTVELDRLDHRVERDSDGHAERCLIREEDSERRSSQAPGDRQLWRCS